MYLYKNRLIYLFRARGQVWISSLSPLKYPPLKNLFADVATIFLKGRERGRGEEREKGEKKRTKSDLKIIMKVCVHTNKYKYSLSRHSTTKKEKKKKEQCAAPP